MTNTNEYRKLFVEALIKKVGLSITESDEGEVPSNAETAELFQIPEEEVENLSNLASELFPDFDALKQFQNQNSASMSNNENSEENKNNMSSENSTVSEGVFPALTHQSTALTTPEKGGAVMTADDWIRIADSYGSSKKSNRAKKFLTYLALAGVLISAFPFLRPSSDVSSSAKSPAQVSVQAPVQVNNIKDVKVVNDKISGTFTMTNAREIYKLIEDYGTQSEIHNFMKQMIITNNNVDENGFLINPRDLNNYLSQEKTGRLKSNELKNLKATITYSINTRRLGSFIMTVNRNIDGKWEKAFSFKGELSKDNEGLGYNAGFLDNAKYYKHKTSH